MAKKDSFAPIRSKLDDFENSEDKLEMLNNIRQSQAIIASIAEGWGRILTVETASALDEELLNSFLKDTISLTRNYLTISEEFADKIETMVKVKR